MSADVSVVIFEVRFVQFELEIERNQIFTKSGIISSIFIVNVLSEAFEIKFIAFTVLTATPSAISHVQVDTSKIIKTLILKDVHLLLKRDWEPVDFQSISSISFSSATVTTCLRLSFALQ